MSTMMRVRHIKKGDNVVALSGSNKGKTGKVVEVRQAKGQVKVEGIGMVKRHTRPSQQDPKGGIVEKNRWLPASIFQVCDNSGKALGRVAFKASGREGNKERVFSKAKGKA